MWFGVFSYALLKPDIFEKSWVPMPFASSRRVTPTQWQNGTHQRTHRASGSEFLCSSSSCWNKSLKRPNWRFAWSTRSTIRHHLHVFCYENLWEEYQHATFNDLNMVKNDSNQDVWPCLALNFQSIFSQICGTVWLQMPAFSGGINQMHPASKALM